MCDCLEKIDDQLQKQEFNRRKFNWPYFMDVVRYLNGSITTVALRYGQMNRKDDFETAGYMRALYCPFCGAKYPFPSETELDKATQVT